MSEIDAFIDACFLGDVEAVTALLDAGADVNAAEGQHLTTPLHAAVRGESLAVITLLLERGAAVDARDISGRTPLWAAAERGFLSGVDALNTYGADVNALADRQESPLYAAAYGGHMKVVERLVEHGADLEAAEFTCGRRPLHAAAAVGRRDIVEALLEAGADVNAMAIGPDSAADVAEENEHVDLAEWLRARMGAVAPR